jgi:two-component system, chemotaxis family, response regulator Rcp1
MEGIHILLVEDNEGDIVLTLEAFEEAKFNVDISIAKDGEQAINFLLKKGKYVAEKTPDLILLDINLPRKNGFEVLEFIKNNDALMQIPVIILTTSSSEKDILNAYRHHASCFITKPLGMDEFQKAIHEIESFWFNLVKLPLNPSE